MPNWLSMLRGRFGRVDAETLALRRDLQALRLQLGEHQETIERLKREIEILRAREETHARELVEFKLEGLFADIASPAAQLLTQAHLLEHERKPVEARDVIAVGKRLLRVLADSGLKEEGRFQESVPFDPNRHEPLGEQAIRPGEPVVVQFVGFSFQGKIICRARVKKQR